MRPAVVVLGALVGLLAAQGQGNDCPHKKSATLLPSFTVTPTPTATESTASPVTTSGVTTTAGATSHEPTTATHRPPTTPRHGNTTVHPTTSNSTATSPNASTSSPHPAPPPPPPPSPSPGPQEAVGDYTWTNGSQPCVRLQARIQIGVVYPTQGGGEAWGISVLNPNKTKPQGGCEGARPHLLLSFPFGQLSFGFEQEPRQGAVYLKYLALEYNVSFPQAAQWTFSGQNSSLRALQAPLGQSFGCRNASILLPPALRLDLLHLKLQAAQLPPSGAFGPSFSCPSDQFNLLPLIIGLISLGLLTLLLVTFCIVRRRPPAYQPL
ncbi:macrosialin [Zalophus californianus]|uniref:Macrosialin n=1 Tax=Zalophus californianus TaxID=9704 RepID=A0A6J2AZS5_ZALCA|nr:macrosialin [Zalophus californianus]